MLNLWILLGVGLSLCVGIRMLVRKNFLQKIFGLALVGHSVNLLLILSGGTPPHENDLGVAAFIGGNFFEDTVDPLPQALILTAIVIGFGVTGFLILYYLMNQRDQIVDKHSEEQGS